MYNYVFKKSPKVVSSFLTFENQHILGKNVFFENHWATKEFVFPIWNVIFLYVQNIIFSSMHIFC